MGFVERELEKLGIALDTGAANPRYPEIYAAQMALSYALDPTQFTCPSDYFSEGKAAD
jgi:hypothetical protein